MTHGICLTALLAGGLAVPTALAPGTALAADSCPSAVATYVLEAKPGASGATPRTLRKYVDSDPKGGDADGTVFDTGHTGTIAAGSRVFTGGDGVIYEILSDGTLKSYKDHTATGGQLLTAARVYDGFNWTTRKRVWAGGDRIFSLHEGGKLEIFKQGDPKSGKGELTLLDTVPFDRPAVVAFRNADDVWAVGRTIYTLKDGEIRAWSYKESGTTPVLPAAGTVVATGLDGATQAWSPGPGTVYTASDDGPTTVKSYTGTPLTLVNADVRTGIEGEFLPDTAACLTASDPVAKPYFGTAPDSTGTETAPAESEPDRAADGPAVVSGRFTLGDGSPAAGLPVVVEAMNSGDDAEGETRPPVLGRTTTAPDGSWSLTVPDTLPADVRAAVDENGGALNVSATVAGQTPSGVPLVGLDHTVAAPEAPATGRATAFAAAASLEPDHSIALIPALPADAADPGAQDPTPEQTARTYAAVRERTGDDSDEPTPLWQSDRSRLAADHNPYLVNGTDVSSQRVTPYNSGTCYTLRDKLSSRIAYTTVGEAHAYWDAKASFDYDSKMSSNVDVAVSSGSNWKLNGGVSLGGSIGHSTGFTAQGPYFGKQYKVPIKYTKYKYTHYCGGIARSSWKKIIAGKYTIPAGGKVGTMGKDVKYKDGPTNYARSPRSNRGIVERNTYFQLSSGKSIKWTGAATVYNITFGASTQYDREHKQRITAGSKHGEHDIWGKNGRLSGRPGLFFSY
ncbi:hypothetical protein [Streptomyces sp. NPDC005017]|uniref:hypothetical protein n=1 Tax=Streptomyces sp. NPDC005017 TaxID=3364706 RepID=UPI0036C5893C